MKAVLLLFLVAEVFAVEHYVTLNDHFDYEALIKDPEGLKEHLDCALDKGPCTDLTESFKKNLHEAVELSCSKCNPAQKHMVNLFLEGVKKTFPDGYKEFRQKYDPKGIHFDAFEAAVANH